MSTYTTYEDNNRVDSATDLSLNHSFTTDPDLESSQTISASSVMPYSAPWSQYNPWEPDHLSPYAPSDWPTESQTFKEFDAPCDSTFAFEPAFERIGSGLRCSSPDAESPHTSCSPPTPPLPLPWAAASTATASPTYCALDYDIVSCGQCSQEFTGRYRRGNLARHVRQKHQQAKGGPYTCTADGCFRVYQRPDARLKHMRKKHPELPLPAMQRRRGTEHYSTEPLVAEDTVRQQYSEEQQSYSNLHTTQHPMDASASVAEQSTAAHSVFATLQHRLDHVTYSKTCDNFFMRWERIVQELYNSRYGVAKAYSLVRPLIRPRSSAYPTYAKVLADIYAAVEDVDVGTHACASEEPVGSTSRAPHQEWAGPRGNGRSSLARAGTLTSPTDRVTKPNDRKQHIGNPGKNVSVVVHDDLQMPEVVKVDCPVFKHHFMHGTPPPCNGCRAASMSQVRGHLNPSRTGTHGGYPAFVRQCSRCKDDFIDEETYNSHKFANSCAFQSQSRLQIQIPWARQYLKLFPTATRVPLPWPDEEGWLPDSIMMQCRMPSRGPVSPSPFLGQRRLRSSESQAASSFPANETEAGPSHDAAMGLLLQDLVTPNYVQSQYSSNWSHDNYSPAPVRAPQQVLTHIQPDDPRHFRNLVQNWGALQGDLVRAEPHLTDDEVRDMAYQAQETHRALERMYHHRQMQQAQSPAQIADVQQEPEPQQIITHYFTPVQQLPLHNGHYHGSGISTQPSSYAYGAGSSGYHPSTFTNPSSILPSHSPALLSPFTPISFRRTSLPFADVQDESPLRRALPSRISLPEVNGLETSPYLEPSVPQTPDDDDFLSRRLW